MGAQPKGRPSSAEWTIAGAEALLASLAGVLSARVVAKPGGEIEEIHLLTTSEVGAKQTVRNVESALLAHFDLTVDHRKISVAQTNAVEAAPPQRPRLDPVAEPEIEPADSRILFAGVRTESQRSQVHFEVEIEWQGKLFRGEATGADVAGTRMKTVANATLAAVESLCAADDGPVRSEVSLVLDGVKLVDAFERRYALTAVHALSGRQVQQLNGLAVIEDSPERAIILATLQATDRWMRGRI
jgi:hypothetical protein